MPEIHSVFQPSSAARNLVCTPALRLNEAEPNRETSYTSLGVLAHSWAEYKTKKLLGLSGAKEPEDPMEDNLMDEATNDYAAFANEIYTGLKKDSKDPFASVEQLVRFDEYLPGGFGTCDFLACNDEILHILDLKYGLTEVSAVNNWQLYTYACAADLMLSPLYNYKTIRMSIFQPRLNHIETSEISKEELMQWVSDILIPNGKKALAGEGELKVSEACRFCKVAARCKKLKEENMKLAKLDFKEPALLTDEEIEEVLDQIDKLQAWANSVKEYAFTKALQGKVWTNYKLVEGRSNRKFINEEEAAKRIQAAGFNPYEQKMLSLTELQKLLGKVKFHEITEGLIYKPTGKPALVKRSDKRPEFNTAAADFKDIQEE